MHIDVDVVSVIPIVGNGGSLGASDGIMQLTRELLSRETTVTTLTVPDRFRQRRIDREQALREITVLGCLISRGTQAIGRCYLRITDTIREFELADGEVREALRGQFADSRISELLRVANSPNEVYNRWQAGFWGFKAALRECRYYNISPPARLIAKQKQRAAERLVKLATDGEEIRVKEWILRIQRIAHSVE